MSAPVLSFTPRAELGPAANLNKFIALCRQSDVLGARSQFDKNVWEIGHFKGQNKQNRVVFSTLEASDQNKSVPAFPTQFLDFAKAAIVYLHDKQPVVSQSPRVGALRCLEAALRESGKGSRPTAIDEMVLDSAVELARQRLSPAVTYRTAGQIEYIAEFMRSKGFIELRQRWEHGVKKPQEIGSRISKEARQAREEKLPSAAALRAMGGIFYQAIEPADVMISSVTALLLCAPERINEVMRLRRNCLVDGDGEYRGKMGLRWAGSKGAPDTTKWLPTEMVPIARKAIENLTKTTAPAQQLAAWYSANPKSLYLHENAAHLRDKEILSLEEVGLILWGDEGASQPANTWAKATAKLAAQPLGGRRIGYFFKDVERAVIAMLPETFPYAPGAPGLLCRDSMAVMRTNEMHSMKATWLCMFSCVDQGVITNHFGAREGRVSIFERFGYTEDDGSPISLRSHALRHYLNTLAQTGGLSSTEIAAFSGRKDLKQNRAYDHMSSDEVQAPIAQALQNGFTSELEPAFVRRRTLVNRSEYGELGLRAAHTTQYGWCIHDFASEPCPYYRDCINCEEQECVKGDAHKKANLLRHKSETEYLLEQARQALSEEEYGADTWVKHQQLTLDRVNALLSILEDPNVPDGTRIRLDVTGAQLITTDDVHPVKFFPKKQQKRLT